MADHQASGAASPPPQTTIKTTPRTVRSDGGEQGITKLRGDIAEQMEGEFSITKVEDFFSGYLPFEPTDAHVDAMVRLLLDATERPAILVKEDGDLRFDAFPVAPCRIDGTETPLYRPLSTISDAIGSGIVEGRKRNGFRFRVCPETILESQISGSNNKIDGCFTSDDPETSRLSTSRIACVFEYKLEHSKEIENNIQAVSANVQIMNDDARRMFTYGITIVQGLVTLWYHSRSHSEISESFNFVENPRLLIKVFMSFLFADEEELGYDPMVTQDPQGNYLFKIPSEGGRPDRYFRTGRSISEYRSNNITGRMARVWKVVECDSNSKCLSSSEASRVLKDVWLEDSALTESQIQSQIFADIEEFLHHKEDQRYITFQKLQPSLDDLAKNEEYRKYFIKIETDYTGKLSKPRPRNSKRKRRLFSHDAEPSVAPMSTLRTSNRCGNGVPRPIEAKTVFDAGSRAFSRRKQYRVVFREVCEAVGDLETLSEVADVLSQAVVALRLMYCAGWVHRDISSGNILAHRDSSSSAWQAKLSDLEYARRFSDSDRVVGDDPKTGTPYFMPHEILSSHYIPYDVISSDDDDLSLSLDFFSGVVRSKAPEQPLVYNFQHDLESIWWIFLWTATSRVSHQASVKFGRTIFQNTMTLSDARSQCLLAPISTTLTRCLHPSLKELSNPLDTLRALMHTEYVRRQRRQRMSDLTSYINIHSYFVAFFKSIMEIRATWGGTALVTHHRPVATTANVSKPGRRKRLTKPRDDDAFMSDACKSESSDSEGMGQRKKPRLVKSHSRGTK